MTLSDSIYASSGATNNGLRTSSYHFGMYFLMDINNIGDLDKALSYDIERCLSSTLMDAYDQLALICSQLVRPVTKFIKGKVKQHT